LITVFISIILFHIYLFGILAGRLSTGIIFILLLFYRNQDIIG